MHIRYQVVKSARYVGNPFQPNPRGRWRELIPIYKSKKLNKIKWINELASFSGFSSYTLIARVRHLHLIVFVKRGLGLG